MWGSLKTICNVNMMTQISLNWNTVHTFGAAELAEIKTLTNYCETLLIN